MVFGHEVSLFQSFNSLQAESESAGCPQEEGVLQSICGRDRRRGLVSHRSCQSSTLLSEVRDVHSLSQRKVCMKVIVQLHVQFSVYN